MPGPYRWRKRVEGHFCRWTMPREAILDLLTRTSQHLTAKEIYASLLQLYPGIGLTTVYRTLDLLEKSGLIKKFNFGRGENRYEFASENKPHHHHLICTKCGQIIDYSDFANEELELVKKTAKHLAEKYKFIVHDHNIEFYGLCQQCQKRQ